MILAAEILDSLIDRPLIAIVSFFGVLIVGYIFSFWLGDKEVEYRHKHYGEESNEEYNERVYGILPKNKTDKTKK